MTRRRKLAGLSVVVAVSALLLGFGGTIGQANKYFFSPCPANGPEQSSDFEILHPPTSLDAFYEELSTAGGPELERSVLATVDYAGRSYPIYWLRKPGASAAPRVLIAGGVHGDERAALLALPKFLDAWVSSAGSDAPDVAVVAPINPIGVAYTSRYNGAGCDINRDFGAFRTIEAAAVRDALRAYAPDLVIAPHEGPQRGAFVIVTARGSAEAGHAVVDAIDRAGLSIAQRSFLGYRLGRAGLSVEAPWFARVKQWISLGSLGTFLDAAGIGTYTVETSWSDSDFESRMRTHEIALRALLDWVRSTPPTQADPTP